MKRSHLIAVGTFVLGLAVGRLLSPEPGPSPDEKSAINNKISINACIERGGIPLFDAFATHYHEEAMMTSCQMTRP